MHLINSLVFRLIFFGMLLVTVGLGYRVVVVMPTLAEDIKNLVANQQLSIANYVARDIDQKIIERRSLITRLTADLPPALLNQRTALASWLAERQRYSPLFSSGLMLIPASGQGLLAETPVVTGRAGLDYATRDWFRSALAGQEVTSRPTRGRANGDPIIIMAAPVRSADGKVLAVLAGVELLDSPSFLKPIQTMRLGNSGGFLLVSPADKVFVAASDPAMVLKPTPPPGVNQLHDKAMAGYRGTGVTVNAKGIEELSAMVTVPSTGWFVVARMPTDEAFQPMVQLRKMFLRNSVIVAVVVLLALLLILPRMFRPLTTAARQMRAMADGKQELQPLPVGSKSEIGEVAAGFNYLLEKLRDNDERLRENEARMAHLAHHDALTGLPNRLLFEDRLHQAIARAERAETAIALLFLDLDGFKPINDEHGHEIGDAVLRQVAERLLVGRRKTDTVARLGGDEFVLLLTDAEGNTDAGNSRRIAVTVAETCIAALGNPFFVGGHTLQLGVSIGIVLHAPGDDSADHLLNRADVAMYAAKQAGRGRYEFFTPEMLAS